MLFYLVLLIAPITAAAAERFGGLRRTLAWLLLGTVLAIFIGLRRHVGCDWDNYLLMWTRSVDRPFYQAIALGDPAFMLLNRAAGSAGFGLAIVNLVAAVIFTSGLLMIAQKGGDRWLALLISVPVLLMITSLAITRQSVSIGLLMWAIVLFVDGRTKAAAALILSAPLFHWTAIVLVPLVPIMVIKRQPPLWLFAMAGLLAGTVLSIAAIQLSALGKLEDIALSGGAWLRQTLAVLGLIATPFALRTPVSKEMRPVLCFLAGVGAFAIGLGLFSSTAMDRISYYAIPLQMLAIPRALRELFPTSTRLALAQAAIATIYLLFFLSWLGLTTQTLCYVPYDTYLRTPHYILAKNPEPFWLQRGLPTHHTLIRH